MNRYIDTEKLKEKINEVRQDWLGDSTGLEVGEFGAELGAAKSILDSIDEIIDSLQQEQPVLPSNLDEAAFEYENTLWEDGCKDCGYSPLEVFYAFKAGAEWMTEKAKQEQPEVDLEKEIDKEWAKCEPMDEGMGLESANIVNEQFDYIARHFCEFGMSVMRERITNPDYNQKVVEKIKSEYPMDETNARKEDKINETD